MLSAIIDFSLKNKFIVLSRRQCARRSAASFALRNIPLDAIPDLSDVQVIVFTEWMARAATRRRPGHLSHFGRCSPRREARSCAAIRFPVFRSSMSSSTKAPTIYWARSRVLEYLSSAPRPSFPKASIPSLGPDATGVGWVFEYAA